MVYLALVIGGVLGGVLRYAMDCIAPTNGFPIGTLTVNLAGAFALGLLYGSAWFGWAPSWVRIGLGTGFIGSFTTFSTFCFEANQLEAGHMAMASMYGLVSMMGGPGLAYMGDRIAVLWASRRVRQPEELTI